MSLSTWGFLIVLIAFAFGVGNFVGRGQQLEGLCADYPEEMDRIPARLCYYD